MTDTRNVNYRWVPGGAAPRNESFTITLPHVVAAITTRRNCPTCGKTTTRSFTFRTLGRPGDLDPGPLLETARDRASHYKPPITDHTCRTHQEN